MTKSGRRLLVIHNPVSGSRNNGRFKKALKLLEEAGCYVAVQTTLRPNHAFELATAAGKATDNWSAIVAAGGDGTISEVANGLRHSQIPLGIIPLGTANVVAREIGVGLNLQKVISVLATATPVAIYPGLIADERFLLMVGAGYDSLAVSGLDPAEKKKYGALAYVFAALRALKHFKQLNVSVTVGNEVFQGASIIVSRARLFGGPFVIAPNADLRSPGFQIVVLKGRGIWPAVKYGLALMTNRIWKLDTVDYFQTDGPVEIIATPAIPCQRDGDGGYDTPSVLRVDDVPLNILAAFS